MRSVVYVGQPKVGGIEIPSGAGGAPGSSGTIGGDVSGSSTPATDPGGIFEHRKRRTRHEAPATSSLNLLGRLENWKITPGTQLEDVILRAENLTGAQLEKLLKLLPDGATYELSLTREEEGEG